jgi:hypothetical protein
MLLHFQTQIPQLSRLASGFRTSKTLLACQGFWKIWLSIPQMHFGHNTQCDDYLTQLGLFNLFY